MILVPFRPPVRRPQPTPRPRPMPRPQPPKPKPIAPAAHQTVKVWS